MLGKKILFEKPIDAREKQIVKTKEQSAKSLGKKFYCRVLSGLSDYNLSVNCDMTVSCCCLDHDGSGLLGDLSTSSLKEIFSSETAQTMRSMLFKGRLPIFICANCGELKLADKKTAHYYVSNYSVPERGIMVENTVDCTVDCLSCCRDSVLSVRRKRNLSLEDIKRISREIKDNNIKKINYFKLGEPFFSPTIYEEMQILREENPDVRIYASSNGLHLDNDVMREAASMFDGIAFSVDGITDEMVLRYQRRGSFNRAYANMRDLVRYREDHKLDRPQVQWKYVLFTWNDTPEVIQKAIDLSREANIDLIDFVPAESPEGSITERFFNDPFFASLGRSHYKNRRVVTGRIGEDRD